MTTQVKLARIKVFLLLGGASAVLFGIMTGARNPAGWALAVWGIGLLAESLGMSHHLAHPIAESEGAGTRKEYLTMGGILAVSIIPALDFLVLPPPPPRAAWYENAGLILCALGLLALLRSKVSWEFWFREDVLAPAFRRQIRGGPNLANRWLEFAGVILWATGISTGFGSLAGVAAAMTLLAPGMLPQQPREAGKE